jgi:hypothetical protein
MAAYLNGKDAFVKDTERAAIAWRRAEGAG